MLIWAVSGLKGRGRFRSKRFSVLLVFEDPEGLLISIDRRFLSKVRFPTFRLSLCRRSLAHRQQPQPFSTLSSPASSDRSDDSNRIRMTSRIQNVSPNAAHFDSIPPSASTASANPHQANPTDLTTPKKFEKHARRSWRRSSAHRPHNAPSPSQGFAGMSLIQVQMPMPIDIVSGGPRVAGDPVEAVEELKECRSPSTLSTTSSSGIDSTGTNETGETVPHSNSDSALGEECPKLSDSDDVDSTSSFPGHFQAPPQHPFIPPQLLPFALCGVLPAVPSEEDLERFRFFRQQHNFYKNYFARQRRLNPNSISYAPTPPNPMQEYFFISYETMDSFLDYLEALYPQLTRSRSTTMQSSDESCCSMPATIQPRAEAAEPSIPFRYGVDSHPEGNLSSSNSIIRVLSSSVSSIPLWKLRSSSGRSVFHDDDAKFEKNIDRQLAHRHHRRCLQPAIHDVSNATVFGVPSGNASRHRSPAFRSFAHRPRLLPHLRGPIRAAPESTLRRSPVPRLLQTSSPTSSLSQLGLQDKHSKLILQG
ncbi:hypothetical protein L596_008556 [Steinernema carpocapsae]|uniref:Uncharacterized protein n=1 Tax=Steinernema carpocapsae TaxID=34508 RepID=A0A4V6A6D1_STECR|nr:hypothetical protein L596_008556 [Steinernema carpocapsae]